MRTFPFTVTDWTGARAIIPPTRERLAHYKKQASEAPEHMRPHYANWKAWKRAIWQTPNNTRSEDGKRLFSESLEQYGKLLGYVQPEPRGYSEPVSPNNDKYGFYCDHWQSGIIRGAVIKLRTPRGTLYVPATDCTEWDGTVHYISDFELVEKGAPEHEHEKAIREAARSARHYAEKEAEEAREYAAKYKAEVDQEEARETIHATNKEALALIKEIKQAGTVSPAICRALRAQLTAMMETRTEQFEVIEKRKADFWSAVEGM